MKFALILIALLAASPARAASLDMSTQTCQDWLDADDDVQEQMTAWLHGYVSGHSASTLYDVDGRADAAILKGYCQSHPTTGVISAAAQWRH
jgi:acid stress chaperone HdeB